MVHSLIIQYSETRNKGESTLTELPRLILAVTPEQAKHAQRQDVTLAHIAYRLESGPTLTRFQQAQPGPGGLLYLGEDNVIGNNYSFFFQQLLRECAARHFQGVIADLPPGHDALVSQLDALLPQNTLTLYLPEHYHATAPKGRLLVTTALSGGTLRRHLQERTERYGAGRIVAVLEQVCVRITPPDKTGQGHALTQEELASLRQRLKPQVHWSPELCLRYFTYSEQGKMHFVLFDDRETLLAKRKLCGELGIRVCLGAWMEMMA